MRKGLKQKMSTIQDIAERKPTSDRTGKIIPFMTLAELRANERRAKASKKRKG